jgi:hypothetical protein
MPSRNEIDSLNLHEALNFYSIRGERIDILRVVGGWIYTFDGTNATFVSDGTGR